jgi:hypothetical protein
MIYPGYQIRGLPVYLTKKRIYKYKIIFQAPLMANFDPTLNNRTIIKYVDNGTHFICTWENLVLQDQPENGEIKFK